MAISLISAGHSIQAIDISQTKNDSSHPWLTFETIEDLLTGKCQAGKWLHNRSNNNQPKCVGCFNRERRSICVSNSFKPVVLWYNLYKECHDGKFLHAYRIVRCYDNHAKSYSNILNIFISHLAVTRN